jgi:hypothetical protein
VDSPGRLSDLLLEALEGFNCTSADLVIEEGEPGERGVTCEVDELDARVTFYGDRLEVHCANFMTGSAASVATVLENVWLGLAGLDTSVVAKTHSLLLETDMRIRGAVYQDVLSRLARPPEALPGGSETAVVHYLPADPSRGFGESSLVLNRLAGVKRGLEVNATLVYSAESLKPVEAISAAKNRLSELLRNLGLEWIED